MAVLLAALSPGAAPEVFSLLLRFLSVTAGFVLFLLLAALAGCLAFCRRPKE